MSTLTATSTGYRGFGQGLMLRPHRRQCFRWDCHCPAYHLCSDCQAQSINWEYSRAVHSGLAYNSAGPLRAYWEDHLLPIARFHHEEHERLTRGRNRQSCIMDCWVICQKSNAYFPAVVVTCADEKAAKALMKRLNKELPLEESGLRVLGRQGNIKRATETEKADPSPFAFGLDIKRATETERADLYPPGFGPDPTDDVSSWEDYSGRRKVCGAAVRFEFESTQMTELYSYATIGGLVFGNGCHFAITVAHAFLSEQMTSNDLYSLVEDQEEGEKWFDFTGSDSESEEDSDPSILTAAIDGLLLQPPRMTNEPTPTLPPSPISDLEQGSARSGREKGADLDQPSSTVTRVSFIDRVDFFRPPVPQGLKVAHYGLALDWALLTFDESVDVTANTVHWKGKRLEVKKLANKDPADDVVLIVDHRLVPRTARCSGLQTYLCCGPSRGVALSLQLSNTEDGPVAGKSGSWVIDCVSGDLYGILVAENSTDGVAYMFRARDVFNDIRSTTGFEVGLLPPPLAAPQGGPRAGAASRFSSFGRGYSKRLPWIDFSKQLHSTTTGLRQAEPKQPRIKSYPTARTNSLKKASVWFCCECGKGGWNMKFDHACPLCGHVRKSCCVVRTNG